MSAQRTSTLVTYWYQVPFHILEYGYGLKKKKSQMTLMWLLPNSKLRILISQDLFCYAFG